MPDIPSFVNFLVQTHLQRVPGSTFYDSTADEEPAWNDAVRFISKVYRNQTTHSAVFIVLCTCVLTVAALHTGTHYTPTADVIVYCLIYSLWLTICLPWLVKNLDKKTLVLVIGVLFRLFAAEAGILAWGLFRGHGQFLQRALRMRPLLEPSLGWLTEAGYNLRYGIIVASIVAALLIMITDVLQTTAINGKKKSSNWGEEGEYNGIIPRHPFKMRFDVIAANKKHFSMSTMSPEGRRSMFCHESRSHLSQLRSSGSKGSVLESECGSKHWSWCPLSRAKKSPSNRYHSLNHRDAPHTNKEWLALDSTDNGKEFKPELAQGKHVHDGVWAGFDVQKGEFETTRETKLDGNGRQMEDIASIIKARDAQIPALQNSIHEQPLRGSKTRSDSTESLIGLSGESSPLQYSLKSSPKKNRLPYQRLTKSHKSRWENASKYLESQVSSRKARIASRAITKTMNQQ